MSWLSPRGRIGRGDFWLGYVLPLGVLAIPALAVLGQEVWRMGAVMLAVLLEEAQPDAAGALYELMDGMPPPSLTRFFAALAGLLLVQVAGLVGAAKRWHDLGQSGWWNLLLLVPLLGWGIGFVALGCLRGQEGANRHGPGRARMAPRAGSVPAIAPPPPPAPPAARSPWG